MYSYKVEYLDDYNYESVIETGVVGVKNYQEAIKELTNYYGEESIEKIEIFAVGPLMTTEELIEFLKKEEK